MRDAVERGDKPQTACAHEEHNHALPAVEYRVVAAIGRDMRAEMDAGGQAERYQRQRSAERHDKGWHHHHRIGGGRDQSVRPKRERREVADNGRRAAAVGGKDNDRAVNLAHTLVLEHGVHDAEHEARGGRIVKVGGKQESDDGQHPQQRDGALGAQPFADKVEAAVVVEHFHNGHRGEEVQHHLCAAEDIFCEYVVRDKVLHRHGVDGMRRNVREELYGVLADYEIGSESNVKQPTGNAEEHGNGGLVHSVKGFGSN